MTPSPTVTPKPTCEPLARDGGFSVTVGRVGDQACVIWRGVVGPVRVVIEEGRYVPEQPVLAERTYDAIRSPFTLPPGALSPFRGSDPCFQNDSQFTVRAETVDGVALGAEAWSTCARRVSLADGCSTWSGGDLTALSQITLPSGEQRVCIMWPDMQTNETGFRIVLGYPNSGEEFTYTAPANTVEFLPPPADTEGIGQFNFARNRKDWDLQIFAITPAGEVFVGGGAVTVM